jgi:hypothetical protein
MAECAITEIFADVFGKTVRTGRYDRDALMAAGLIAPAPAHRQGGRRWTIPDVASFLIAEASGRPILDCSVHVPRIRALEPVRDWCHVQQLEAFRGFTFWRAETLGDWIEGLITDHRDGCFARYREAGAGPLQVHIVFEGEHVWATVNDHGAKALVSFVVGNGEPIAFRGFKIKRDLSADISQDNPASVPTVFERLGAVLKEPVLTDA